MVLRWPECYYSVTCNLTSYLLQATVTYSSTYVLVALSIDRYDAITHPMNFSGSCKYSFIFWDIFIYIYMGLILLKLFIFALLAIRSIFKLREIYITRPRNFAEIVTLLVYILNVPIPKVDCNSGYPYPAFSKLHSFTVLGFNLRK